MANGTTNVKTSCTGKRITFLESFIKMSIIKRHVTF